MTDITPTQEDRDAAAAIHLHYSPNSRQVQHEAERMRSGKFDHDPLVQAFARHRQAAITAALTEV